MEWISVEEGLPPPGKWCVVMIKEEPAMSGFGYIRASNWPRDNKDWIYPGYAWIHSTGGSWTPTHWVLVPEPPKEE